MQQTESVREVVNCDKFNKFLPVPSYSYTAPTALGIKVEQIRANFLLNVFKTFFFNFLHLWRSRPAKDQKPEEKEQKVIDKQTYKHVQFLNEDHNVTKRLTLQFCQR